MASVQLSCTLCPKKPTFSDLSHLLTHLASKGHLSHYFRAQVKSRQDMQIANELQAFDHWYNENDMEKLLHERLMQKEKKKANSRGRQPPKQACQAVRQPPGRSAPADRDVAGNQEASQDLIDPRLRDRPNFRYRAGPSANDAYPLEDQKSINHFAATHFSSNIEGLTGLLPFRPDTSADHDQARNSTEDFPTPALYRIGHLGSRSSDSSIQQSSQYPTNVASEEEELSPGDPKSVDAELETEGPSEYATLKGVIWPGMDLFDSASPHAKRIRNQKKHASCLDQMRTYAATIEPNEDIYYYPSWELKQSREITGQVESSSPERDEPPPRTYKTRGRTKRPRGRPPLATLDVNRLSSRRYAKRSMKGTDARSNDGVSYDCDMPSRRAQPFGSLLSSRTAWTAEADDELDWSLTFGSDRQTARKRGLSVLREDDEAETNPRFRVLSPGPLEGDAPRTPCPKLNRRGAKQPYRPDQDRTDGTASEAPLLGFESTLEPVKESKDSSFDLFNSLFEMPRSGTGGYPDLFSQRYFSMNTTSNSGQFSKTVPPYLDFIMGYSSMPLQELSPERPTHQRVGNPLSSQHVGLVSTQNQMQQHSQSPTSLNPLLDFTSIWNQSNIRESDDETIDDKDHQDLESLAGID